jgi:hypothetical protein
MKSIAKLIAIVICVFVFSGSSFAQQKKIPKWVPEQGNWMVESNIKNPLHSVIYFYTNEGVVIYKETIDGMKLDLNKKKVKMRLKKVLGEALIAWDKNKRLLEEQEWVVSFFKRLP